MSSFSFYLNELNKDSNWTTGDLRLLNGHATVIVMFYIQHDVKTSVGDSSREITNHSIFV